jgi:hypothetical protein
MDAFLERQLEKGKKLAMALVEHLKVMGAAQCRFPIGDYVVTVSSGEIAASDGGAEEPYGRERTNGAGKINRKPVSFDLAAMAGDRVQVNRRARPATARWVASDSAALF